MKIGIITLPLNHNYGGTLQCYALMNVLKGLGHTVVYIDLKFGLSNNLLKKIWNKTILTWINYNSIRFINKFIVPKTEPCINYKQTEIILKNNRFDYIIVGSDQVWRLEYMKGIEKEAFLYFPKLHFKRVSYAASFGVDNYCLANDAPEWLINALLQFKTISVRESSGISTVKQVSSVLDPVCVLDPTFLLDKEMYYCLANRSHKDYSNLITSYILDETPCKNEIKDYVSKTLHKNIISLNGKKYRPTLNPCKLYRMRFRPIYDWIKGIQTSDFVVTDSFHGMVFSILFEKQFLVIGNKDRGMTRFTSLLHQLDLDDRLVNSLYEAQQSMRSSFINYSFVNMRLEKLKKYSLSFLYNSLSN